MCKTKNQSTNKITATKIGLISLYLDKQRIRIAMQIGEIVEEAIDGNPDLFYGIADLSGELSADFNGYHYAIVLGRKLDNRGE